MCRWIAYFSYREPILLSDLVIRPEHSLLKQVDKHYLPGLQMSDPAAPNDDGSPNNLTNIDGYGVGWYSPIPSSYEIHSTPYLRTEHPEMLPAVYRSILPPLHDVNLENLANSIESRVVLAHIRASTTGMVQTPNCHPFKWGRFLFQHNGGIGRFADIQLELMSLVGPRARSFVKGTTDTEWLAALFFHCLDPSETATWLDDFPLDFQLEALSTTISTVIRLVEARGGYFESSSRTARRRLIGWFSANLAITDGDRLVALRFAYPPRAREAPSLYWSTTAGPAFNRRYRGHPDRGSTARDVGNRPREDHLSHVIVASEPMSRWDSETDWELLRQGEMVLVDRGNEPVLRSFQWSTDSSLDEDMSVRSHLHRF